MSSLGHYRLLYFCHFDLLWLWLLFYCKRDDWGNIWTIFFRRNERFVKSDQQLQTMFSIILNVSELVGGGGKFIQVLWQIRDKEINEKMLQGVAVFHLIRRGVFIQTNYCCYTELHPSCPITRLLKYIIQRFGRVCKKTCIRSWSLHFCSLWRRPPPPKKKQNQASSPVSGANSACFPILYPLTSPVWSC